MTRPALLDRDAATEPAVNLRRLALNALWPDLLTRRWRGPHSSRRLSDYDGSAGKFKSIATATIPKAPSMNDTVRQGEAVGLAAVIRPDDRNGLTYAHDVVLFREDFLSIARALPEDTRDDLARAIDHLNATPAPYAWQSDSRGNDCLIRVYDPYLTPAVYTALHAMIDRAVIWARTPARPVAENLIRDEDVHLEAPRVK